MMKIERYWEDCVIYLVKFHYKTRDGEKRLIDKMLIFDSKKFIEKQGKEKKAVEKFVFENFSNVLKIEYVDLVHDYALRLR